MAPPSPFSVSVNSRRDRARHRPRVRDDPGRHRPALAARLRGLLRDQQRLVRHPTPPRPMTRPRSQLAALACLLGVAGCGSSHTATTSATSGGGYHPSTRTTAEAARGRAENAAAWKFAAAYVRFLDGAGTAGGLPDATSSVRVLSARAGSIPAVRRRGTLLITGLRAAVGASDSYLLTARDDTHTFYAQMTFAEHHGRWLVTELTPPDFVQVLAPAGPPPPQPPRGSQGAEVAARLFLRGYLPWLYGQKRLRSISAATSGLLADLKAHPPRIPATMLALRPTLAAIAMQHRDHGWRRFRTSATGTRPTSSYSPSHGHTAIGASTTSARPRGEHAVVDTPKGDSDA